MFLVSQKMSLAAEVLRKAGFGNVATLARPLGRSDTHRNRRAFQQPALSTLFAIKMRN